jgi:hypothetical protein
MLDLSSLAKESDWSSLRLSLPQVFVPRKILLVTCRRLQNQAVPLTKT